MVIWVIPQCTFFTEQQVVDILSFNIYYNTEITPSTIFNISTFHLL